MTNAGGATNTISIFLTLNINETKIDINVHFKTQMATFIYLRKNTVLKRNSSFTKILHLTYVKHTIRPERKIKPFQFS